ncbi:MAG: hypothetical protein EOP00_32355 [Pedobacter sp.]|nr:MAG: hypothetical protein EOP00_32355 [Pedobacter sp.]
MKGFILYEPAGDMIKKNDQTYFLSYKIYATDEKGELLRDGAKVLSLSPDKLDLKTDFGYMR